MGLTTSGIFSGINTDDVVSKLMQIERQPLFKLQAKEADYQAKISGLGTLLSSLSSFKSTVTALKSSDILGMKVTSGDSTIFTATTSTGASAANHSITITNIAAAQSIYSTTFVNTTDSVADLTAPNTTQKLQIQVGSGAVFTITIDSTNNTLTGIKNAINDAKSDVTASIMNDGTGNRLILTSNETGVSNKIVVKVDEDNDGTFEENPDDLDMNGLSQLAFNPTYDGSGDVVPGTANLMQSAKPKDAVLVVDTFTITKSSNTISDVIEGVTLTLLKDSGGDPVSLNVSKDTSALKAKVSSFVSAFNAAMKSIKDLQGTSARTGIMHTDSTISSLKSTVRNVITNTYNDSSLTLLGVTHDKDGVLSFDSATFDEALATDDQDVVTTLNTMATSLESTLDTYIKTSIPDKQNGYTATTKLLTKREEELSRRLDKVEEGLRKKFNSLDQQIQLLQGQGNYISQQFAALNNSNK